MVVLLATLYLVSPPPPKLCDVIYQYYLGLSMILRWILLSYLEPGIGWLWVPFDLAQNFDVLSLHNGHLSGSHQQLGLDAHHLQRPRVGYSGRAGCGRASVSA